jgi:hypothetical protein
VPQLYLSQLDEHEIDHGLRQWCEGVGSGLQVVGLGETLGGVVEDEKSGKEEKTEGNGEGTGDEETDDEGTADEGKGDEGTGDEETGA